MNALKKIGIFAMFVALFPAISVLGNKAVAQTVVYTNPAWAPAYYPGVRYYYLPDIETYYDLANQDFVYLDNGQWVFSYDLPPMYSSYNLNTAFVVALNLNVFEPWRHYQYYISHYPRFYYRTVYRRAEIVRIRGFNENIRTPYYWSNGERERQGEVRRMARIDNRVGNSRPPEAVYYSGRHIGHPVHVRSFMRAGHVRGMHYGKR